MDGQDEAWAAVAAAVTARMRELGMRKQIELVRASGLSDATVRVFMTGRLRGAEPNDVSREQLATTLGWSPSSIDQILQGGDPTVVIDQTATAPVDLDEVMTALRQAVAKSSSRDERLSNVVKVTSETTAVLAELADVVRANREQLALIAEHLGVEVVPSPPRAAPSPASTDPRH